MRHMKYCFTALLLLFWANTILQAQQLPGQNAWFIDLPEEPQSAPVAHKTQDWWPGFPFKINYSQANDDDRNVIYMLNSRFPFTGKNDLVNATVAFNQIIDENEVVYNFSTGSQLMLDTLYLWIGHENNTNNNDTLIIDIVHTDSQNGYPTEQFLNQRVLISNRSFSNVAVNDWRYGANVIKVHAGNLAYRQRKFAVRVRYYGSFLDTFGIVAGFRNEGACVNTSIPNWEVSSRRSDYYPNSYRLLSDNNVVYPRVEGIDIYRDCNNDGVIDSLLLTASEAHLQQNFRIWALVRYDSLSTIPVGTSPSVSSKAGLRIFPNPVTGETLQVELPTEAEGIKCSADLLDIQGKVFSTLETQSSAGILQVSFPSVPKGIYQLRITAESGQRWIERIIIP